MVSTGANAPGTSVPTGDERPALVNATDVGMIERGRGSRASRWKRSRALVVGGGLLGEKLQRDMTTQDQVFGLVDDAHAAATELFQDAIVRDGPANHGASQSRT